MAIWRGSGMNGDALLIVVGGDLLDIRDGADHGSDFLELLDGIGVGEIESAVAILSGVAKAEKHTPTRSAIEVRMGVPFRTLDAANRANVQKRSRDQEMNGARSYLISKPLAPLERWAI